MMERIKVKNNNKYFFLCAYTPAPFSLKSWVNPCLKQCNTKHHPKKKKKKSTIYLLEIGICSTLKIKSEIPHRVRDSTYLVFEEPKKT